LFSKALNVRLDEFFLSVRVFNPPLVEIFFVEPYINNTNAFQRLVRNQTSALYTTTATIKYFSPFISSQPPFSSRPSISPLTVVPTTV
jgi:hypothetical protein